MAPRLLAHVHPPPPRGRLVSGDALYCEKTLGQQLRAAGADYLVAVKAKQPDLLDDVVLLFTDPPPGERFLSAQTVTKHGGGWRHADCKASAGRARYRREAGWPDVALVLAVETQVTWPAYPSRPTRHDVRSFLSSLPPPAPPATVLRFVRTHWHRANRLHGPRDVTLGEDACQVRVGRAPQALVVVRKAVLNLLRGHAKPNCAATIRACAWSAPAHCFNLLGLPVP